MQSAPSFRKDLNVVVEAPDGSFVAYCGMWLEPVHAIAYVEPVATDPDYRRMGLGRLRGERHALLPIARFPGALQPFGLGMAWPTAVLQPPGDKMRGNP